MPLTSAINTTATTAAAPGRDAAATETELKRLFELVTDDFAAVNELIPRQLTSDVDLVEAIGRYIVESGGKRLRPLIVLLVARCCGYAGADQVRLAAIIEFLHTATLLHDDVVDRSGLRRGRTTANALWGNAPSVLVGDFLYSRAFQLMVELESMDIMAILADATNVIAEGEVLQLANVGNASLSEQRYYEVIRCKTAMLFQAAAHSSALLATDDAEVIARLREYGVQFGMAYQLVDDWLDYAGDSEIMGKNVGDDLAEGKATLPLIYTMANGNNEDAKLIRDALESKCADKLDQVCVAVCRSGALDYTRKQARLASARALEQLLGLPANEYRDALEDLARAAVARIS
jgi:octaprenyl-diphosphate synthase